MKAIGYQKPLDIDEQDALVDIELPVPVPGERDLLVRVKAISVNPVDTKIRKRAEPEPGSYKVLGWDAAGVVEAVGSDCELFNVGDEIWYAGAVDRPGSNAELQCVDERIAGKKPVSLDYARAAAMPLTTITAWEILFDRLQARRDRQTTGETLLIIGAAGGVGSMLTQLASQLTGLTVVGTASRKESRDWVSKLGADFVIDHTKPLGKELEKAGIENITYAACLTRSDLHFENIIDIMAPFGRIAMIDDPGQIDVTRMKSRSLSLHWEFMYTRSLYQTPDMVEQHHLLDEVSRLVDAGQIQSTFSQHYGVINASNLKKAHAMIESGKSIGKIVLEGF